MCDYSLHVVASRAAEAAETLIVTTFYGTSTRGFASPAAPTVAVCLRPGTEIAFEEEACRQGALIGERLARFRQIDLDNSTQHHDALEFSNGVVVKVTDLSVGQKATILQLPADPKTKQEPALEASEVVVA